MLKLCHLICHYGKMQYPAHPIKCAFLTQGGKFLGYIVTQMGIKINMEVKAILDIETPRNLTKVH